MAIRTLKAASRILTGNKGKPKVSISQVVVPQLPHERDESVDGKSSPPTKVMKQAAADLKRGLTDTDRGAQMTKVYKNL